VGRVYDTILSPEMDILTSDLLSEESLLASGIRAMRV